MAWPFFAERSDSFVARHRLAVVSTHISPCPLYTPTAPRGGRHNLLSGAPVLIRLMLGYINQGAAASTALPCAAV